MLCSLQDPENMWAYEVDARSTGDKKSAREERRGDVVVGQYSAMDPDGSLCVVDYSVAPDTDFQATKRNQYQQDRNQYQHNRNQYQLNHYQQNSNYYQENRNQYQSNYRTSTNQYNHNNQSNNLHNNRYISQSYGSTNNNHNYNQNSHLNSNLFNLEYNQQLSRLSTNNHNQYGRSQDPENMWAYEVDARSTGDKKSAREERRGDVVVGQYSAMDPDGSLCVVDYSVAPDTDFQATVTKQSTHENFQSQSQ
ncbi:protein kinase 4-like [Homarus americanus]|uniref:protein kinase 4-like n=1 Tax=Homarus americanus TaxID=6706 RepID=UPI001C43B232|nr:protein kinase 4-like [Homarus americanus]